MKATKAAFSFAIPDQVAFVRRDEGVGRPLTSIDRRPHFLGLVTFAIQQTRDSNHIVILVVIKYVGARR